MGPTVGEGGTRGGRNRCGLESVRTGRKDDGAGGGRGAGHNMSGSGDGRMITAAKCYLLEDHLRLSESSELIVDCRHPSLATLGLQVTSSTCARMSPADEGEKRGRASEGAYGFGHAFVQPQCRLLAVPRANHITRRGPARKHGRELQGAGLDMRRSLGFDFELRIQTRKPVDCEP